jgi:hypothetical protein
MTEVERLTKMVTQKFATFGGGQKSDTNSLFNAFSEQPPVFALGVDVGDVVRFVLKNIERKERYSA